MKLPPDLERRCLELAGLSPQPAPAQKGKARPPVMVQPAVRPRPAGVEFVVPLHLTPVTNKGAVKRGAIGRSGRDRRAVAAVLARDLAALAPFADAARTGWPVRCRIVRLGGGEMDDDNLQAAAKWVRDTVALFLGVDDSPRGPVRWQYGQEPGGAVGVRVELETREAV